MKYTEAIASLYFIWKVYLYFTTGSSTVPIVSAHFRSLIEQITHMKTNNTRATIVNNFSHMNVGQPENNWPSMGSASGVESEGACPPPLPWPPATPSQNVSFLKCPSALILDMHHIYFTSDNNFVPN